jgi:hypothetical protein
MNYEVIWDGTANTVRGRLLSPTYVPVPVVYAPAPLPPDVRPNRRGEAIELLRRVRAVQGCAWFTVREVLAGEGIRYVDMHNALTYLRRKGEIVRERKSPMQNRPLGYVQKYRWVGEQ